ncbi:MAG: TonB-dependent receptor [Planctomycetota bacterium]|nr:TonB-dependent receptor [Planctomycetota bacterium]
MAVKIAPCAAILLVFGLQLAARSDDDSALEQQIEQLRADMDAMKMAYEHRIGELERQLKELKTTVPTASVVEAASPTPLPGMKKETPDIPDLSVIGNIVGKFSDSHDAENRNKVLFSEAEVALQGFLHPDIRGDVILHAHRHEDGDYHYGVCEGYATFMSLLDAFTLNAGRRLLPLGKANAVHGHHRHFADSPLVSREFLGDEGHGPSGNGVNLAWLTPLPFFLQWEVGAWHVDAAHHHDDGEEEEALTYAPSDECYTTRLWSSFALSDDDELEIGVSGLSGYGSHFEHHTDRMQLVCADLTYRHIGEGYHRLIFQNEFFWLDRRVPSGADIDPDPAAYTGSITELDRFGLYSLINYRFDKTWDVGLRYDYVQKPFPVEPDKDDLSSISPILTWNLTECSKLRLQYTYDFDDKENSVLLQFVFGIGPHSHPLE